MKTQTIEVEGLPEGWRVKTMTILPRHNMSDKYKAEAVLELEKIKPSELRLVEIQMSEAKLGDFMRHPGDARTIINVGAERHDETYTFYREVKPDSQEKMMGGNLTVKCKELNNGRD